MTDEITQRPAELQRELPQDSYQADPQVMQAPAQQMQANMASGISCPYCGTINEPESKYCASCGALLQMDNCPNCGSEIDPEADFCEVCHHYIRPGVCSFCGAAFDENSPYCPECGSPRGGIVCPTCHTLNDFAFCKQCGQPLTAQAKDVLNELRLMPEYRELVQLSKEYDELQMQIPCSTDEELKQYETSQKIRERVLMLLAQDKGVENPEVPKPKETRKRRDELDDDKRQILEKLAMILDRMAIPQQPSPAKVRNYAMAQKPMGIKLAWMCNYKHALHSSPCGCAKPQMGGKWVILGHNSNQEIKDDK